MGERPKFGIHPPDLARQNRSDQSAAMFPDGEDLPLFSGTPIPAIERPFVPEDHSMKQGMLPGMPSVDYAHVLAKDRALRRRRQPVALPLGDDIFTAVAPVSSGAPAAIERVEQTAETTPPTATAPEGKRSTQRRT